MTARGELRAGAVVAAMVARAEAWLLEPAEPARVEALPDPPRPVVAVRGLAERCGASTVARGLAAVLAADDPGGAALVTGEAPRGGLRLATPAASRLAREVAARGCDGARAAGRLCLVPADEPIAVVLSPPMCPVVIEVAASSPPADGLALADHVVLVAAAGAEPALAAAVESSLARAGHSVDVVFNRLEDGAMEETPRGAIAIPEARLAAQVAHACRGAYGPLAPPLAELAARCRAIASIPERSAEAVSSPGRIGTAR